MKQIIMLMMLVIMQCIDAKVMKRAQNIQPISVITPIPVIAPAPSPIPSPMPAPMMKIDQDAIKKKTR